MSSNLKNAIKIGYMTLLCAFLSLFWVVLLPQLTKIVNAETVTTAFAFSNALINASTDPNNPTEIRIGRNLEVDNTTLDSGEYAVIDLNGNSLSTSVMVFVYGSLTVIDTGTSGTITSTNPGGATIFVFSGGSFTLEGGTIVSSANGECVGMSGGTFVMNGGQLSATAGGSKAFVGGLNSSFTQNDGVITGPIEVSGTYTQTGGTNPSNYTITFNANGGQMTSNSSTTATATTVTTSTGEKLTELLEASRDGWEFGGWYTQATGGTEVTTSTVFTANTEIFAHWSQNAPAEPVISPGTGTYTSAQSVTITCATSGATIKYYLGDTEPATPSSYSSAININESTTLTAWAVKNGVSSARVTRTYTINLASTDHTITVTDDGHGTGTATPSIASSDAVINLSATPSTGYEFDRWTSTTNGIHFANYRSRNTTFGMVDENVTVKANFKAKSNPKKDDDDDDHHEESSSPSPEKPSWTPAKAAATIAAQKAQKQQAAATQLASIQTMLRTKTSDRAGTGRNVIDLDMTKVDILDPATVNLLLLNNRFAFNVKISVPGGLTTTIMIPANFNFRPFIKADGTMNIHEVLWWIISKKK